MTTTAYKDFTVTRGDAFKPGVITLTAQDSSGAVVPVPVSGFSDLFLTVRKAKSAGEPDDTDAGVVARIGLTLNAQGVINVVGSNQIEPVIHGSVVRTWLQGEYFYDLSGHLAVDGEPCRPAKGRILMGWSASRTP